MKIIRRNTYIAMPVSCLLDRKLSVEAKGLLTALFAMPEDARLTEYDLGYACRMTAEEVLEVIRELEKAGYLVRDGDVLRVFDAPQTGRGC